MGVSLKFNIPSITPKLMFRLLVLVFWTQNTILKFVVEVIERLPFISRLAPFFIPVLFISLFALSLPYIVRQIKISDILFYLTAMLVVVMTLLIYENSAEYIVPELWRFLGLSLPIYFVGVIYEYEEANKDLFWGSLIGVIAMFSYQIFVLGTGRALDTDNMSASYNTLPSIMYLIYWAISHKGAKNWIIALSASMLSFVFGTRGPIVAIMFFLALGIVYKVLKMKNLIAKILIILAIGISVVYITTGDTIMNVAVYLSEKFGEIGFSTRIFDFIIEDQIAESEGRELIRDKALSAINQRLILGYGFMGDRASLDGSYVHNIILEYMCSYGIIFGSVAIVITFLIPLVSLVRSRQKNCFWFMLMLVCMVFIKLMLSGSYTNEAYFFFMIGFAIGVMRRDKKRLNRGM